MAKIARILLIMMVCLLVYEGAFRMILRAWGHHSPGHPKVSEHTLLNVSFTTAFLPRLSVPLGQVRIANPDGLHESEVYWLGGGRWLTVFRNQRGGKHIEIVSQGDAKDFKVFEYREFYADGTIRVEKIYE